MSVAKAGRLIAFGAVVLTEPIDLAITNGAAMIEVTNAGSSVVGLAVYEESIQGKITWGASGSGNYVKADVTAILAQLVGDAPIAITLTLAAGDTFTGNALVEKCDVKGATTTHLTMDLGLRGTGPQVFA